MKQAVGIITVVQEGRFRLDCDGGRSLQFTLDRRSWIEPQDLPSLRDARVVVAYRCGTSMTGHFAQGIRRADA